MRLSLAQLLLMPATLVGCSWTSQHEQPAMPAASDPEIQAGLVADGFAIVEENCTTCHAIGASGESPRYDAPPLRTVLKDRDREALSDDFREGIHVGADDMPDFDFGPLGTDAVIAYLASIQIEEME